VHFHQKTRLEASGLEDLIGWFVYVAVEQKAWGTFAFLFGVGFAVLLRRLEARGAAVVPIYLRRMATLAVIGIAIQVFLGFTILFAYAVWGVVLLLVRRWPSRALLGLAAVSAMARPVVAELDALRAWASGATLPAPAGAALSEAAAAAAAQPDYAALVAARWSLFVGTMPHGWRDLLPDTNLPLFIIGLLALRHGILDRPKEHTRAIVGWMGFGLLAWASSWIGLGKLADHVTIPGAGWPLGVGLGLLEDQWLCFFYVGVIVLLLAYRPVWTRRLRAFGLSGRMALTNYALQAAALDYISSAYGLGLKLRPLVYAPAAVALFALEAWASAAWLARFRFGPIEWLWRMATYARRQPIVRHAA
jgi:uncharacterized protein